MFGSFIESYTENCWTSFFPIKIKKMRINQSETAKNQKIASH